jgi:hypothetical protein
MAWVVEFKSQAVSHAVPELWLRESNHPWTTKDEALAEMVQCIFDDSDYEFRVREIKETTNDQDQ